MAIDPTDVPRFAHGSRIPGWDESADLEKSPLEVPDPATTHVPDDLRAEIEAHVAKYPPDHSRSATIPALWAIQRRYGWCTPEGIEQAACVLRLTPAELSAVATFYDMLDTSPTERNRVYVCTNISCSLRGADELLETFREHAEGEPDVHVRGFECLGACDIAPMASVNGTYVGPLDADDVPTLLRQLRDGEEPLPEKQLARRPSADPKAREPQS
ncbi:MAG: NAD(P)H-dependent oxidoreductase subunit E [Solirubrobacteraceae bacterium]|nr:NAD(P)H-dependent oxidoreductase subunit E [Solirubrobacteraceae bacterium]